MAARKKPESQLGLSLPAKAPVTPTESLASPEEIPWCNDGVARNTARMVASLASPAVLDPEVSETTKVNIEDTGGGIYLVSKIAKDGNKWASVMWTREELQELVRRVTAALESK